MRNENIYNNGTILLVVRNDDWDNAYTEYEISWNLFEMMIENGEIEIPGCITSVAIYSDEFTSEATMGGYGGIAGMIQACHDCPTLEMVGVEAIRGSLSIYPNGF